MSLLEMKQIKKEFEGTTVIKDIFALRRGGGGFGNHRAIWIREVYVASLRNNAGNYR